MHGAYSSSNEANIAPENQVLEDHPAFGGNVIFAMQGRGIFVSIRIYVHV